MSRLLARSPGGFGSVLFLAALVIAAAVPGWAQTVTVVRPNAGPGKLAGVRRMDATMTAAPAGYAWERMVFEVRDTGGTLLESGNATLMPGATTACYECVTTMHLPATAKIKAVGHLQNLATGVVTTYPSTEVTDEVVEECSTRQATREKIRCACACDGQPTRSFTSPLSGAQRFSVPVTSWEFKGESYTFALQYNSHVLSDPQAPTAGFSGLGERNSYGQSGQRWSHSFDQWIDRYEDESWYAYCRSICTT